MRLTDDIFEWVCRQNDVQVAVDALTRVELKRLRDYCAPAAGGVRGMVLVLVEARAASLFFGAMPVLREEELMERGEGYDAAFANSKNLSGEGDLGR